eukprot:EG_transcript_3748
MHKSFKFISRQGLVASLQKAKQCQGSISGGAPAESSQKDLVPFSHFSFINAEGTVEVQGAEGERPSRELKEKEQLVEATDLRQGEGSRVQLRSVLVAERSHRQVPAGARSVSFSPEPPEVRVVDISVDEWRGKRRVLHHIAQHVAQHMKDWTIERYGMPQPEKRETSPNVDDTDAEAPWKISALEGRPAPECRRAPSPALAPLVSPGAGPAVVVVSPMVGPAAGREGRQGRPAGGGGGRWSEGAFEGEMDFSLSPLSPQPPQKDSRDAGDDVLRAPRRQRDVPTPAEEAAGEGVAAEQPPGEPAVGRCASRPRAGGAINENEDPGEGGAEPCGKGESVVGRRGRAWRAGVRGSASRWSDGLDQEMDFSQPPFLSGSPEGTTRPMSRPTGPPPKLLGQPGALPNAEAGAAEAGRGEAGPPGVAGSPTVGRMGRQWSAEVKLSTTRWAEESSDALAESDTSSQMVKGTLGGPSGVKDPVRKETAQCKVEPIKLSPPMGRMGKQWTAQVKQLTSRWADGLDEEMDFSVPLANILQIEDFNLGRDVSSVPGAAHILERVQQHSGGSLPCRRSSEALDALGGLPPVRCAVDPDGRNDQPVAYSPHTRPPNQPLPQLNGVMHGPCRSTWMEEVVARHRPTPAIS